jgi:YVTN family beta-propeller protein
MSKWGVGKHIFGVALLVASLTLGAVQPVLAVTPKLNLDPSSVALTEGGSQEIDVSLPEPIIGNPDPGWLFIELTPDNPSRLSLDTRSMYYASPSDWTDHKTLTVSAYDDMVVNGDVAATISYTISSNSEYYDGYTGTLSVTIHDNDQPPAITAPVSGQNIPAGSLMVTGTSAANQQIAVKIDGVDSGTTMSDGSGNWSLLVPKVTDGNHSITAQSQASQHYAYMANQYTNAIDVVNVDNHSYVGAINDANSVGATYNKQKGIVYSASDADGNCRILGYDPLTYEVVANITPGIACYAISIALGPGGNTAWLLYGDGGGGGTFAMMEADLTTNTGVNQQPLAALTNLYPSGVAILPDGSQFWVRTIDGIEIFNASDHTHVDFLPLGAGGTGYRHNIVFNSTGTTAYTADISDGLLYVINVADLSIEASVALDEGVNMVALTPDESQLYIASSYAASIYVLDTATNTIVDTHMVDPTLPPESVAIAEDGQWVVGDDHGTGAIFFGTVAGGPTPSSTIYAPFGGSYYSSVGKFVSPPLTVVLGVSTSTSFSATAYLAPNTGLGAGSL